MSAAKTKKYSFVKTMLRIIPMQYKSAPWHCAADNAMGILHGLSFCYTVIATQYLFDAITKAAEGKANFKDCLIPLFVLASVTLGQQILNGAQNFHGDVLYSKSSGKMSYLLHRKLLRVDPALFENTDFLDDVNKAREGAKAAPSFAMDTSILTTFYGAYSVSIGAYLFNLKPALLIALLVAFIPAMLTQIVRVKIFTKLEERSAPLRREYEYYQKTLCDREYFKETRILGAYRFFHKLFSETLALLTHKTWQAERKTALLQLALNLTSFAGMAVSAYMLFTAAMSGEITVGAFAAVFQALNMLFVIIQAVFININLMNREAGEAGKVANFVRILDAPERAGADGEPNFSKGIAAENISFTYPGTDCPAVKNVSLTIANNETVAVVGENGAGKSTLVRLLTGIYRPSEGKVKIGGLDSAVTAPSSLYRGISGVFQKYQRYKMTLEENVTISDAHKPADKADVEAVLEQAGAELDIPLDTMLSPEFDGADISGGQWQRVAIARGLYRANGFIALDEPTSAIDPIEETRIYEQFRRLAEGKCALIVTHRLGSAKLADRVIVMDAGGIIDAGTHEELLSRPGKYADMWAAQAQWYERPENH